MNIHMLSFVACAFNIFGLLFFMSDAENTTDILKKMDMTGILCSCFGILIVEQIVARIRTYFIFFLFAEYIIILLWYYKQKKWNYQITLRGIISIVAMLIVEIVTIGLYYQNGTRDFKNLGMFTHHEIQIACYLSMAMTQYCLMIIREIKRIGRGFRKVLLITVGIKSLEDIIWLGVCIGISLFTKNYAVVSWLFILSLVINYIVLFTLKLKVAEKTEQINRADIHVNAYEYYLNMEEEHLLIRQMYHEMKNQMMIMDETSELSHVNEQIYSEKLKNIHQIYHTGQPSLDMLLFDGKLRAEKRNIKFQAVVSQGCLSFMDEEDINIIFSNAIINAIEACEKIIDGPKEITIKAGQNLNDTLIYVKNTVSPKRSKGNFATSKKNKIKHGIGMTSIQECAEKYKGYVSITEENDTFQLAILFAGSGD